MTDVIPDPKPVRRVRASRKQWEMLRAQKLNGKRCRVCQSRADSLHHLIGGAFREDVADNLVGLCGDGSTGCHGIYTSHLAGESGDGQRRTWADVADRVAWTMSEAEQEYVIEKKGVEWLNSAYPIRSFVDPLLDATADGRGGEA